MTLLLLAGLAACDRQSQPSGQGGNASEQAPPTSGEVTGSNSTAKGEFSYTLDRSKAGTPAPDLIFQAPGGGDTTLRDFEGKPMLVNLWATWCAPCIAEMPALDAIAASYGEKRLTVLTVSQDNQGEKAVKPFLAARKLPHLKGYTDVENNLGFYYATSMLPTTVLYDADGKEILRVIGAMDWASAEGRKLIDEAIKG